MGQDHENGPNIAGTYVNVIRIIPPLVTTSDEVVLALSILGESLAAVGA